MSKTPIISYPPSLSSKNQESTTKIRNKTVLAPFEGRIESSRPLYESDLLIIGSYIDKVGLYQLRKAKRQFERAENALRSRRPDLNWTLERPYNKGWKIKYSRDTPEIIRPSFVADAYVPATTSYSIKGSITIKQEHDKEKGLTSWRLNIYDEWGQYFHTAKGNLDCIFKKIHATLGPAPKPCLLSKLRSYIPFLFTP